MEHVIRKLFASPSKLVHAQQTRMSQEAAITSLFGLCLKRSPTNHDNVAPKVPPADSPPTDKPSLASETEDPSPSR